MKEPVSIVFFLPSFKGGGAENVFIQLANEFAIRNVDTTLLVANPAGELSGLVSGRVSVHSLDSESVGLSILKIAKFLYSEKPSHLISTMMYANIACAIANLAYFKRCSHVAREALPATEEFKDSRITTYLAPWIYKTVDHLIFPNHCMQKNLTSLVRLNGKCQTAIIPNPIDSESIRKKSGIKPPDGIPIQLEKPYIIGCGRLTRQKDFNTLIEAFKAVRSRKKCSLIILGDGECRDELSSLIIRNRLDKDTWLAGFQTNPFYFIAESDVFVLSSLYEGMPNSLMQAIALSKKIVATDCECGPSDLSKTYDKMILVPISDSHAMADAICKQLDIDTSDETENILDQCDIELIADKYLDFLSICR